MDTMVLGTERTTEFSAVEKWALSRAMPASMFIRAAGTLWVFYFLWMQSWPSALLAMIITSLVSMIAVRQVKYFEVAQTLLGKIALLHLHPVNLSIQLVALAPTIYGFWMHSAEAILIGLSLLFLGHVFGWEKVDRRFAN
jgi:hypothetical protein